MSVTTPAGFTAAGFLSRQLLQALLSVGAVTELPLCLAVLALAGGTALSQPLSPPAAAATASAVPGAVELSVADLVSLVHRHNPNLRAALQGRDAAAAAITTATALPNPELEVGGGQAERRDVPGHHFCTGGQVKHGAVERVAALVGNGFQWQPFQSGVSLYTRMHLLGGQARI